MVRWKKSILDRENKARQTFQSFRFRGIKKFQKFDMYGTTSITRDNEFPMNAPIVYAGDALLAATKSWNSNSFRNNTFVL